MILHAALLIGLTLPSIAAEPIGIIRGTVVNASEARPKPCSATVVLRIQRDGRFIPLGETVSDAAGQFQFDRLPIGGGFAYMVGANRDGVHYPGPRIILTADKPAALVDLSVRNAVAEPNPLVIRRFEITICPEPGMLTVHESMEIDNPSAASYVGQAAASGAAPVTLQLAIPRDFERTTFDEEFFGRRFSIGDGKLVTGIPWTPGPRTLKYTYVIRTAQAWSHWARPLDLPCDQVVVRVCATRPNEITCNLPVSPQTQADETVFEYEAKRLDAGHVISVDLGHLPLPWIAYLRWLALALLATLIAGAYGVIRWKSRGRTVSYGAG